MEGTAIYSGSKCGLLDEQMEEVPHRVVLDFRVGSPRRLDVRLKNPVDLAQASTRRCRSCLHLTLPAATATTATNNMNKADTQTST